MVPETTSPDANLGDASPTDASVVDASILPDANEILDASIEVESNSFGWYGEGKEVKAYMPVLPIVGDLAAELVSMRVVFEDARDTGKKLIFRPRYNDDGNPVDAEYPTMLLHIALIGPLVTEFADQIVVYQVGIVGRWGEFHGSLNFPDDSPNSTEDNDMRLELVTTVLDSFPGFVAVRKPKWHMEISSSLSTEDSERLTVFDDCIGCGDNDGGTFPSDEAAMWRSYMGGLKIVGGEISQMGPPAKTYAEMLSIAQQMNLSYANIEWNPIVWESWTQTQMDEFTYGLENGW
jgi:hypothetical protein